MKDRGRKGWFSGRQCIAGRALLGLSVEALARVAGIEAEAIELYEAGEDLDDRAKRALTEALNAAGVMAKAATVHAGEGVRVTRPAEFLLPALWPYRERPRSRRHGRTGG